MTVVVSTVEPFGTTYDGPRIWGNGIHSIAITVDTIGEDYDPILHRCCPVKWTFSLEGTGDPWTDAQVRHQRQR